MTITNNISLAMQFAASICWAIGAILNSFMGVGDVLQFSAAVAWFLSNCASAYSMVEGSRSKGVAARSEMTEQPVKIEVG